MSQPNGNGRRKLKTSVALIDTRAFTRQASLFFLQKFADFTMAAFATVDELLADANEWDVIISASSSRSDIQVLQPRAIIILGEDNSTKAISQALELGVRGYVPTTTTPELVIEIIRLIKCGGTYFPARANESGPLTNRQATVLNYLRLGKPNKLIAYEMNLSESTIKAHIAALMRRMHAKNRTELVARAHELR